MKSRSERSHTIMVKKFRQYGNLPAYLSLMHRHLEKAVIPIPSRPENHHEDTFLVPVDLLRIVLPLSVVDDVTEVEVAYKKAEVRRPGSA